jgi:hypothetical protein
MVYYLQSTLRAVEILIIILVLLIKALKFFKFEIGVFQTMFRLTIVQLTTYTIFYSRANRSVLKNADQFISYKLEGTPLNNSLKF